MISCYVMVTKCLKKKQYYIIVARRFNISNTEVTRWFNLSVWQQLRCCLSILIFDLAVQKDYHSIKETYYRVIRQSPQLANPHCNPAADGLVQKESYFMFAM